MKAVAEIVDFSGFRDKKVRETTESIKAAKEDNCREATEYAVEQTMSLLEQLGFCRDPNRVNPLDVVALEMSIEGLLFRYSGLTHPFHEVVDSAISITEQDVLDDEDPTAVESDVKEVE